MIRIESIKQEECKDWLLNKHYARRMCSISFSFGLYIDNILSGVCTFGMPPSSTLAESICGKYYKDDPTLSDGNEFLTFEEMEDVGIKNLVDSKLGRCSNPEHEKVKIYKNYIEFKTLNLDENKHGELISILLISKSGAEGLDLKSIRSVHIMEPYWNKVRVDQVIGRARRIESHKELPEDQRNVSVYEYVSRFTDEQKSNIFEFFLPTPLNLSS